MNQKNTVETQSVALFVCLNEYVTMFKKSKYAELSSSWNVQTVTWAINKMIQLKQDKIHDRMY